MSTFTLDVNEITGNGQQPLGSVVISEQFNKYHDNPTGSVEAVIDNDGDQATINVTVLDPFKSKVPNVTIDLMQNGASKQQVTSTTGTQSITTTLIGQVDIQASKTGYNPASKTVTMKPLNTSTHIC